MAPVSQSTSGASARGWYYSERAVIVPLALRVEGEDGDNHQRHTVDKILHARDDNNGGGSERTVIIHHRADDGQAQDTIEPVPPDDADDDSIPVKRQFGTDLLTMDDDDDDDLDRKTSTSVEAFSSSHIPLPTSTSSPIESSTSVHQARAGETNPPVQEEPDTENEPLLLNSLIPPSSSNEPGPTATPTSQDFWAPRSTPGVPDPAVPTSTASQGSTLDDMETLTTVCANSLTDCQAAAKQKPIVAISKCVIEYRVHVTRDRSAPAALFSDMIPPMAIFLFPCCHQFVLL